MFYEGHLGKHHNNLSEENAELQMCVSVWHYALSSWKQQREDELDHRVYAFSPKILFFSLQWVHIK